MSKIPDIGLKIPRQGSQKSPSSTYDRRPPRELQDRRASDNVLRLGTAALHILGGILEINMIRNQPLVELRRNLPLQVAHTPSRLDTLLKIKLPFFGIFNARQRAIVRPAQLVTQCVTIWESKKYKPHVLEVGRSVARAELRRQLQRKSLDKAIPVLRSFRSTLFLNNLTTNIPIGGDHLLVGDASPQLSRPDPLTKLPMRIGIYLLHPSPPLQIIPSFRLELRGNMRQHNRPPRHRLASFRLPMDTPWPPIHSAPAYSS